MTELSNGDIIIAGKTNSFGAGEDDILILRLDSEGNIKWQKTYGGRNGDEVFSIAEAANGDIIVAVGTESFGADDKNAWILRLHPDGSLEYFSQDSHAILNVTNTQSNNSNASISTPAVQVGDSQALTEDLNLSIVSITPIEKVPIRGKRAPGFEAMLTVVAILSGACLIRKI